jgi:AmmeMemoRadiSam system protein B
LKKNQFAKVILLGPDHFLGIKNGAICDVVAYQPPLGKIKLHNDVVKLRRHPDLFRALPVSRDKEHSLEVILPFLQTYLGEFQLVPVVVGRADIGRFSDALETVMDRHTLLAVSSDLSHFLAYSEAASLDRETIGAIVNLNPDSLINKDNRACGVMPILILMEIARRNHWQPV